ncbi:hypothetical protein B0H66DRAFT_324581 [Apodospora peruviana]|uniref:Uncharacterized protein n=1 Tax=Apodospora peruviana TaxID=516989 RepID=A0AAE0M1R3_9PEZI|nr:hypothetical protein B0H66DRAFT_324581 [Apodospora peruviana]
MLLKTTKARNFSESSGRAGRGEVHRTVAWPIRPEVSPTGTLPPSTRPRRAAQERQTNGPSTSSTIFVPSAIFQVVRTDTLNVLTHLAVTLDTITVDSMNERLMQERLSHWRTLLNLAQLELPQLSQSLSNFFPFALRPHASTPINTSQPIIHDLQSRIHSLVARSVSVQEHLRAEMSLLESKRGIAQAESVTRLTELAFVFIPMSFAAALLSMQIQELQDAPPESLGFCCLCLRAGRSRLRAAARAAEPERRSPGPGPKETDPRFRKRARPTSAASSQSCGVGYGHTGGGIWSCCTCFLPWGFMLGSSRRCGCMSPTRASRLLLLSWLLSLWGLGC